MRSKSTRWLLAFRVPVLVGVLVILALALFAGSASPTLAADRVPDRPALPAPAWYGSSCIYIVADADDLFRISLRYGAPVYQMMYANGLYSPYWIYRGMMLHVPCPNPYAAPNPYGTQYGYNSSGYNTNPYSYSNSYSYSNTAYNNVCAYHWVRFGEYLKLIAARYGVSWQSIALLNRLYNPNLIYAGMRLAIPCSSGANPYAPGSNPYAPPTYPTPSATAVPGQGSNVTIQDFMFAPATIMVHMGQTVMWRNNGPSMHTTTSDMGVWNSGTLGVGATFSQTFNSTGSFAYHCMIHPFMHGTVVVTP